MQSQMALERASGARSQREQSEPVGRHISMFVRCVIERIEDGQWQAFSLEFGLAVQANSASEARVRLDRMIYSYVSDALIGEDREHADELLSRRATTRVYLLYYRAKLRALLGRNGSSGQKAFRESLALEPRMCSP
jgi:hypothetical protein